MRQAPLLIRDLAVALLLLLGAGVILAAVAAVDSTATAPNTIHYPDLRTLSPSSVNITNSGGTKLLRFDNTVANFGYGQLELRPEHDDITDTTDAYQRLYSHDGDDTPYVASETLVGTFVFHSSHNHWHFEDFAQYELRNIAADGSIGSTVLATNEKVSFCMVDTGLVDPSLEHSPPGPAYTTCEQDGMQGISAGWSDTYTYSLAGQNVNITGLANGDYWLLSTSDPSNRLAESHDGNNRGIVRVSIINNTVDIVSEDTDGDATPDEIDSCPNAENAGQENSVHPATTAGDHCDDPDADSVMDINDNCPDASNPSQADEDSDGPGNSCDNCPAIPNPDQANVDGDVMGDDCDTDDDNDGPTDGDETACGSDPASPGSVPERINGDGVGTEDDDDLDGTEDEIQAPVAGFDCDGDGYKDDVEAAFAWPAAVGPESAGQCTDLDNVDDDGDTRVNDGCPTVGTGPELDGTGARDHCSEAPGTALDDDGDGTINDGCPGFGAGGAEVSCANIADDDGDNVVNDGCPGGATEHQRRCTGFLAWPSDLNGDGALNIVDVGSFVLPTSARHFDQRAGNHKRWDISPSEPTTVINIQDVAALVLGAEGGPARPPMFGNQQAWGNTSYGVAGTCPPD